MSDGSKGRPKTTAGLDHGDKYSYLCLIDTESGEVIEEGLLCAPSQRPSSAASLPSSLCAWPLRRELTHPGQVGCSRGAATRSLWQMHAS